MSTYQMFKYLILEAVVANHHNLCVWREEDLNRILEPHVFSRMFYQTTDF